MIMLNLFLSLVFLYELLNDFTKCQPEVEMYTCLTRSLVEKVRFSWTD